MARNNRTHISNFKRMVIRKPAKIDASKFEGVLAKYGYIEEIKINGKE